MMKMTPEIKAFIEDNIDLLRNEKYTELYEVANKENRSNRFMKQLFLSLGEADIDTSDNREACLYSLLEELCKIALTTDDNDLHGLLKFHTNHNWYGYDIYEVTDFLEQMSHELGIELIPAIGTLYQAINFKIVEA